LLDYQNINYVERLTLMMHTMLQTIFNILATSLNVHNYFDGPNKIIFRYI